MKLLIASDIHGDIECAKATFEKFKNESADKILLLGDLLYHGPRNDLPSAYAPKEVISLLNQNKDNIIAVRGNCDTEVDQMVLQFPILADYAYLSLDGISVFATHGHNYGWDNPPPLSSGEILLTGHTHVLGITEFGNDNYYINPGSVTLPKQNNPKSYAVYEDGSFTVKDFEGNIIVQRKFK